MAQGPKRGHRSSSSRALSRRYGEEACCCSPAPRREVLHPMAFSRLNSSLSLSAAVTSMAAAVMEEEQQAATSWKRSSEAASTAIYCSRGGSRETSHHHAEIFLPALSSTMKESKIVSWACGVRGRGSASPSPALRASVVAASSDGGGGARGVRRLLLFYLCRSASLSPIYARFFLDLFLLASGGMAVAAASSPLGRRCNRRRLCRQFVLVR